MSAESKTSVSPEPDAPPPPPPPRRDLLSKLVISIIAGVLAALITTGFGWWQSVLAGRQHQSDQYLADQQRQATVVQTYIGNMQDLLLHHSLSEFKPDGEVYRAAKEQTILTLQRLDASHNETVLQFLQNAGLVGALDLSNADLSNDDLNNADLGGVGLIGTTLTAADLNGADLNGATMYAGLRTKSFPLFKRCLQEPVGRGVATGAFPFQRGAGHA